MGREATSQSGQMRLIVFTQRMEDYRSAYYQQDVIDELTSQCDAYIYGPGFEDYDLNDSLRDVIKKSGFSPEWLLVSHSWLADDASVPLVKYPHIDFRYAGLPKAIIINKEYARLEEKLEYVREVGFQMAFTHHHDASRYEEWTGVQFHFLPFAVNQKRFGYRGEVKDIDLSFSGILRNPNVADQSDMRAWIMNRIFACVGDLPIAKRKRFRNLSVFWNASPRDGPSKYLNKAFRRYTRLDDLAYRGLLSRSKIVLNTQSPAGLISTRYFECMASKAFVLCERNPAHQTIFPEGVLMEFQYPDESLELVEFLLENETVRKAYVDKAHEEVLTKHTWERRIERLLSYLTNT